MTKHLRPAVMRQPTTAVTLIAATCLAWLVPGSVQGVMLNIPNFSFEDLSGTPNTTHFGPDGKLRDGHFADNVSNYGNPNGFVLGSPIPNWVISGGSAGSRNPNSSNFPGQAPEGRMVAHTNGATLSQVLTDTLGPGLYQLMVQIGNRLDTPRLQDYRVQLLAGGVLLAEDYNTYTTAPGTYFTTTVSYTALPGDPNLGKPLEVRLGSQWSQAIFDNVCVHAPQQIPEPATVVLAMMAALLVGGRAWRAKRS